MDERVPCVVGDMVETIQPNSRPARWRSVEHMVSIIARATCNGQQINGCTGSCRFVLLALSCSCWLARGLEPLLVSWALLIGKLVLADISLQAMFFKRCLLLGGFSLCCSSVAHEVNVVLAVVRQLVIADVIATITRDLSFHLKPCISRKWPL